MRHQVLCRYTENNHDQFNLGTIVVKILAHKTGIFSQKTVNWESLKVAKIRDFRTGFPVLKSQLLHTKKKNIVTSQKQKKVQEQSDDNT